MWVLQGAVELVCHLDQDGVLNRIERCWYRSVVLYTLRELGEDVEMEVARGGSHLLQRLFSELPVIININNEYVHVYQTPSIHRKEVVLVSFQLWTISFPDGQD